MIFLPIAFYCYVGGACVFDKGELTTNVQSCTAQNAVAERLMQADTNVQAFQTTCIVIEPKDADSTDV